MAEFVDESLWRRYEAIIAAREQLVEGSDRELDDLEAELYAFHRDQHHWPLSQEDPRPLFAQWRTKAFWRPRTDACEEVQRGVPGGVFEYRKDDVENFQTRAMERELEADKLHLEAFKAAQISRGVKVLDAAAAEEELHDMEAELRSDLAALKRARELQEETRQFLSEVAAAGGGSAGSTANGDARGGVPNTEHASEDPSQGEVQRVVASPEPSAAARALTEAALLAAEESISRGEASLSRGEASLAALGEFRPVHGVRAVENIPPWAKWAHSGTSLLPGTPASSSQGIGAALERPERGAPAVEACQ